MEASPSPIKYRKILDNDFKIESDQPIQLIEPKIDFKFGQINIKNGLLVDLNESVKIEFD